MAWWSAANMLHATVDSACSLGVFRLLLGAGESGNFIAAEQGHLGVVPAAGTRVPERPRAGRGLGGRHHRAADGGVAPDLLRLAARFRHHGRARAPLAIAGWWRLYHLPEQHPRITPEELALIRPRSPRNAGARPWPRGSPGSTCCACRRRGACCCRASSRTRCGGSTCSGSRSTSRSPAGSRSRHRSGRVDALPHGRPRVTSADSRPATWCSADPRVLTARKFVMLPAVALMPLGISSPSRRQPSSRWR